jgi:hypothetical protein
MTFNANEILNNENNAPKTIIVSSESYKVVVNSESYSVTISTNGITSSGTGDISFTSGGMVFGNGTPVLASTSRSTQNSSVLMENATGNPFFTNVLDGGVF